MQKAVYLLLFLVLCGVELKQVQAEHVVHNVSCVAWIEECFPGGPAVSDLGACGSYSDVWCVLSADGCYTNTWMSALDGSVFSSASGNESAESTGGRQWRASQIPQGAGGIVTVLVHAFGSGSIQLTGGEGGGAVSSTTTFQLPELLDQPVEASLSGVEATSSRGLASLSATAVLSSGPGAAIGGASGAVGTTGGVTGAVTAGARVSRPTGHGTYPLRFQVVGPVVGPGNFATPTTISDCLDWFCFIENGETQAAIFANGNPWTFSIGQVEIDGELKIDVNILAPGGCP